MTKKTEMIKIADFEILKHLGPTGVEYWNSAEIFRELGYVSDTAISRVLNKARTACRNSGRNPRTHFRLARLKSHVKNYAMTRLACLLIVQNANPELPEVARAQIFFAGMIEKQQQAEARYRELQKEDIRRRSWLREEVKNHNKHLIHIARISGIKTREEFARFQDEGYRGLYGGLQARDIHEMKNLKKNQHILDYMGSHELQAHLFRLAQTEQQLINNKVHDPRQAFKIHFEVGRKIRKAIQSLGGDYPEHLHSFSKIPMPEVLA